MKNLYSFFYLKKIVRLKHSQHSSFVFSPKEKKTKKRVASVAEDKLTQLSTTFLCWKNVLFNIFMNERKKTVLQKVNLNFQKNRNQKNNFLKKTFSNPCKKNIQSIHSLQKNFNSKLPSWFHLTFIKIPTQFFFLNKRNFNQICRNIPIKIEKIFNICNVFTNFHKILLSIFTKWQKTFISFLGEQVFFPRRKKLFYSNNMNRKQEIKNNFYLLQKKYLKKKLKFAIFLFQIFFKNIQKFFKKILTKFFFNANLFRKNLNFLFLQLFLELQFSLFLSLKNFQSFLIEQNVLQIFFKKQYFKKKKEIFSFFFKDMFLSQVNSKKTKILDFLFVFGFQNFFLVSNKNYFVENKRNVNFDISQKILNLFLFPQKKLFTQTLNNKQPAFSFSTCQPKTSCQPVYQRYSRHSVAFVFPSQQLKNKFFLSMNKKFISSKKQTKKLFSFKVWVFLWKNFLKFMNKKTSKVLYKLNIQNKQKTKSCFLCSHNILKLGKIFLIFFYFMKIDSNYKTKFEKNFSLAHINKKCSHIFRPQTNQRNFSSTILLCRVALTRLMQPLSLNQMFYLNTNSVLNKTQKKILYSFLKFIKKNIQIFFEYFCVLNCLKTHIEFFPNGNDFQILSHQQLKFSFFRFQQKKETNIKYCMQSLIYSDSFTFFSFLQVFPIINIQKYKNYSFLNIFSIFVNLYSIKKIENLYKIDQIFLLNNFHKTFCETNIQKFFKFFQKKVAYLEKDESLVFFKLFSCYFEKILFHLYKTCKLQQIKIYFSKKFYFVSVFNFSCFQNFCMKNKCFKNSLFEPIHFIYKNYYENFFLFYSMIYLFIDNQTFFKLFDIYFHNYQIFNKWFSHNFKNSQISTKNCVFRNIPSMDLLKIFSLNISKKQKRTIHLLYFHKMFWLFSKKILLKSTKLQKNSLFSFSAFFSSFFIQKSQNGILYLQKKVRKNIFVLKNNFHFNFQGYSVSFFIWKKNSQIFFVFQKKKTSQNIQIHLKQCQQIIKNSIGKKQFFFMKKLQRKMKIWCQEYKNNVSNCQLNSTFAEFSAKKTFHYCDSMLLKYLWNWARKTHPNKNKLWIKKKYFHFIHSKKWFFGKKVGKVFVCLPLHSQTKFENIFSREKKIFFFS